ncbi:MAG TPA: dUTP diphosphatase [Ignavibacteria bacterium]|nr:dUTP diphosphatase [Ignavibacteria bacterium]
MKIFFKIADSGSPVFIPEYKTSGSAGMDLCSSSEETILITSSEYALVPTNLIIEIPEGFEGQIRPRSGLALNNGITVLNSPGTIDCDYRGEIKVLLINHGKKDFAVKAGDRIAQLIIAKYIKCELIQSEEISDSVRGEGGYGSTGTSHNSEI